MADRIPVDIEINTSPRRELIVLEANFSRHVRQLRCVNEGAFSSIEGIFPRGAFLPAHAIHASDSRARRDRDRGEHSAVLYQLVHREADVSGDLAKQDRRDVAPGVEGNRRCAAIGVTELLVRTALAYFDEPDRHEERDDLAGLEYRDARHSDQNGLRADELGLEPGLAVFEQHRDHFAQVRVQFIQCRALAVRAGEPRHVAHVELRIRAMLDHGGVGVHERDCSRSTPVPPCRGACNASRAVIGEAPQPARRSPTPKLQQQLERLSALPKPKQRAVMQVLEAMLAQASR